MNNNFDIKMVCRMDHSKNPTEEQIVDPDFGCAQLNMSKDGFLDMSVWFTCFECRPEMRPVKRSRAQNKSTQFSGLSA